VVQPYTCLWYNSLSKLDMKDVCFLKVDRDKLRMARARWGWSVAKTAKETELSNNSVLRAEHEDEVSVGTVHKLATGLQVDVRDLVKEPALPKVDAPPPAPTGVAEERRALYLTKDLEGARDLARQALWMLNVESYGDTPQKLTAWNWTIMFFKRRVWAQQESWETQVFGPLSEQSLPVWERKLLDQIREELQKAETTILQANARFSQNLDEREDWIKQQVASISPQDFLQGGRVG
jgi:transcriptional regulator with XRE-family HTH domain